jgi:colanic acid/amylovoran biosynthesis glycosyltransferase
MKILYLLKQFPKIRSEAFILNEMAELQKMGHDVWILTDKVNFINNDHLHSLIIECGFMKKLVVGDVYSRGVFKLLYFTRSIIIDFFNNPKRIFKIFFSIFFNNIYYKDDNIWSKFDNYLILRKLLKIKIDIVYSPFSAFKTIKNAVVISDTLEVPLVSAFRALELYSHENKEEIIVFKETFLKINDFITISEFNKNQLKKIFGESKKIDIIHSSIDPDKFKNNGVLKIKNKIITIARFVEKKGIIYLLEALALLYKEKIDFQFVLIGDGPLKETYELKIKELKIGHLVKILAPMKQELIQVELAESVLFVLPCIVAQNGDRDIMANVLKEAMSMEIPVITSDISGISELIKDKGNGFLVPEKNVEKMSMIIKEVLKNQELRRVISQEGRKTIINDFNVKIEAKKLETLFYRNIKEYGEKNSWQKNKYLNKEEIKKFKKIEKVYLISKILQKVIKRCNGMLSFDVYLKIYQLAYKAKLGNMIELGAAHGAATICLARGIINSRRKSLLFTVEKGDGDNGSMAKFGSKLLNIKILKNNIKYFHCDKHIKLIPEKIKKASSQIIEHQPFSLILIDADGALDRDFIIFYNLLLPGADIIIDDYENIKHLSYDSIKNPLGKKYSTYLFVNYFLEKGLIQKEMMINNTIFCKKPENINYSVIINEKDLEEIRLKIKNEAESYC